MPTRQSTRQHDNGWLEGKRAMVMAMAMAKAEKRKPGGGSKSLALHRPNRRPSRRNAAMKFIPKAHRKEFNQRAGTEIYSPQGAGLLVSCLGGAGVVTNMPSTKQSMLCGVLGKFDLSLTTKRSEHILALLVREHSAQRSRSERDARQGV